MDLVIWSVLAPCFAYLFIHIRVQYEFKIWMFVSVQCSAFFRITVFKWTWLEEIMIESISIIYLIWIIFHVFIWFFWISSVFSYFSKCENQLVDWGYIWLDYCSHRKETNLPPPPPPPRKKKKKKKNHHPYLKWFFKSCSKYICTV